MDDRWCLTHNRPVTHRFVAAVCPNDIGCKVVRLDAELRAECEPIEVTRNGLLGGPVDSFRKFRPGPERYWLDDEEVTEAEVMTLMAARDRQSYGTNP